VGSNLKALVDRSPYIFVVMTGSSVSEINKELDSATSRRVLAQTLHPMSFTEFRLLEEHKTFGRNNSGLGLRIRQLLYESESAEAAYEGLLALRPKVIDYWADVAPNQRRAKIDKYMSYANLPFTLTYANNKEYIYQLIEQTLSIIINKDFRATYDFSNDTLRKIRLILRNIANSSTVSMKSLADTYDIDRTILAKVIDAMEKASVLQRIYPHAMLGKQSTKPSKYLFVSPAYRSMFFNYIGSVLPYDSYKGYLLEDTVGLYLSILTQQNVPSLSGLSVTYDNADDFVLSTDSRKICIEVGYGAKKPNQANATKLRHKCIYGLTVCSAPLKLSSNSLTVPLSYFRLC
jgi:predicted AAA+ superfamily ATPase